MENKELLKLLWEELKYRHDLYWRLVFRSVLAVLALIAAPLLNIEQLTKSIQSAGMLILFPVMAMVIAILATWILRNELNVTRGVIRTYRTVLATELSPELQKLYRVNTNKAGTLINWFFLFASLIIAALEIWLLWTR